MDVIRMVSVLVVAFGSLTFAAATQAQGKGGGNKGGGQGGGDSALRLCAAFNDPDATVNYIDEDAGGQYCDGTDGEILADEGLKLSTGTRNPADRTVTVSFQGNTCATPVGSNFADWVFYGQLDTFFASANSTEFVAPGGCTPGDPFAASFNADSLTCLEDTGVKLTVAEMRQNETRYMSMRVNLTDPNLSIKKGGTGLVLTFAEDLGPNVCEIGDAAVPLAIACTNEENQACSEWRLKTFRACAFNYDPSQGGNWRFAGNACPVSTDITFTVKP